MVLWAADWAELFYSGWNGWTMLEPTALYEIWVINDSGVTRYDASGNELSGSGGIISSQVLYNGSSDKIGWQVYYTNPTAPVLEGFSIYRQTVIDYESTFDPENLTIGTAAMAGVWRKTFTDYSE